MAPECVLGKTLYVTPHRVFQLNMFLRLETFFQPKRDIGVWMGVTSNLLGIIPSYFKMQTDYRVLHPMCCFITFLLAK